MKKSPNLSTLSVIILLLASCGKDRQVSPLVPDATLIQQAHQYFKDSVFPMLTGANGGLFNLRVTCPKTPQWDSAYTISTAIGEAVVVPVRYNKSLHVRTNFSGLKLFDLNELTHLLIYRDAGRRYHAEMVTSFPDSVALKGGVTFSGILVVEDWMGQRLHQFKYSPDGSVLQADVPQGQTGKSAGVAAASAKVVMPDVVMTTCYEIEGYNYSEGDPDGGFAWSEPAGCSSSYVQEALPLANTGGLSGSSYGRIAGVGNSVLTINVSSGGSAIPDVQAYFRCFTNSASIDHSYTITICVSQPVPGTRSPWGFTNGGPFGSSSAGNVVNVGHTFIIFKENSAGTIITRNVGLYPQGIVNPAFPTDQAQLRNNENTDYNISLQYTVSNSQFFAVLNYASLGSNTGYIYNLNSNNCTTFALNALAAGGITLSSRIGRWAGGSGNDPGDLGEDIRSMTLGPNMTRNTVENPHPNTTTCN